MSLELVALVLLCSAVYDLLRTITFALCDRAYAWWLARQWRNRWPKR